MNVQDAESCSGRWNPVLGNVCPFCKCPGRIHEGWFSHPPRTTASAPFGSAAAQANWARSVAADVEAA